jgi:hypothetical protein
MLVNSCTLGVCPSSRSLEQGSQSCFDRLSGVSLLFLSVRCMQSQVPKPRLIIFENIVPSIVKMNFSCRRWPYIHWICKLASLESFFQYLLNHLPLLSARCMSNRCCVNCAAWEWCCDFKGACLFPVVLLAPFLFGYSDYTVQYEILNKRLGPQTLQSLFDSSTQTLSR